MGQEYFINSQDLEDKIRQLLPSQGGAGAGFDLSASTQIIPVIDVTESAEGSNLRQDLQTSFGINSTHISISSGTSTIINNTGYYKVDLQGIMNMVGSDSMSLDITDGVTTTSVFKYSGLGVSGTERTSVNHNTVVFLKAGESLTGTVSGTVKIEVTSRQIATIDAILVDP